VVHELFHYIQDLNGDLGENICNLDCPAPTFWSSQ
jgi:hypothetical protein